MGYIAVKGGRKAIGNASKYLDYERIKGGGSPLTIEQIQSQLHFAVDRIMGEGALYAPELAALAFKQAGGDFLEAAFITRAYRTTQPRIGYTPHLSTRDMRIVRRISAAFKDIPGGQILGPTSDYTLRLLNFELLDESSDAHRAAVQGLLAETDLSEKIPDTFPKVVELLQKENLLAIHEAPDIPETELDDVTRTSLSFPASRAAAMQTLARGETGSLLVLAYSNMRGFGSVHPTVGELRVGYIPVRKENPVSGLEETIGEVKVTECDIIAHMDTPDGTPCFTLGYGLCFGHNETKAISMAVLDRAMQTESPSAPSEDQEFVLSHVDGIESMGFCNHFKLPHYVTFQSALDRLRKSQQETGESLA